LETIEQKIHNDSHYIYALLSFLTVLILFLNITSINSPIVGISASVIYLTLNGVFLGRALFGKEIVFIRFAFGVLVLTIILGLFGWVAVTTYRLGVIESTVILLVASCIAFLLNRRIHRKHRTGSVSKK